MNLELKLQKNIEKTYLKVKKCTNMISRNIFIGFKETKKGHLIFRRPRHTMKGKCEDFSCHKERNEMCLVYLECKLQEVKYGYAFSS